MGVWTLGLTKSPGAERGEGAKEIKKQVHASSLASGQRSRLT